MPAFSQPVFDMQRVFRVVLDAMSRPARLCRLPVFPQSVPDGLSPVLGDLALTLCDGESPLWLSPGLRNDGTTTWLRFHCGCPIVEEVDKAAFALVADVAELPPEDFAERWRENTSGFPLGVDMLLCGTDGVAGLPRTTHLERLPQESTSCM